MSKATVSKVTREELQAERPYLAASKQSPASGEQQNANRASLYSTEYIKKLSIPEIEKFFEQFDVSACAKIPNNEDPKFVLVTCKDFNVVFSDYSFVFDFYPGEFANTVKGEPTFDYEAFKNYCDLTERTPDQVISELMTIELFGQRFPSYSENRKKVKMEENRIAFGALPKSLRKRLKTANEAKESQIASTHNKLYFGDYAGNPYLMGNQEDK